MFDALLNEYRYWRDNRIKEAFENPEVDNEALLQEWVTDGYAFHYEYENSITLRQYKQVQRELMDEGQCIENIVNEPLVMWCVMASSEDDWEALFQANKPQAEEDEVQA